ncbi:hypothetical protein KI387_022322, partial [Taxus chinensis]
LNVTIKGMICRVFMVLRPKTQGGFEMEVTDSCFPQPGRPVVPPLKRAREATPEEEEEEE